MRKVLHLECCAAVSEMVSFKSMRKVGMWWWEKRKDHWSILFAILAGLGNWNWALSRGFFPNFGNSASPSRFLYARMWEPADRGWHSKKEDNDHLLIWNMTTWVIAPGAGAHNSKPKVENENGHPSNAIFECRVDIRIEEIKLKTKKKP